MSMLVQIRRNRVTVRGAARNVPLHICMETLGVIPNTDSYLKNAAIDLGAVLLVKDAP